VGYVIAALTRSDILRKETFKFQWSSIWIERCDDSPKDTSPLFRYTYGFMLGCSMTSMLALIAATLPFRTLGHKAYLTVRKSIVTLAGLISLCICTLAGLGYFLNTKRGLSSEEGREGYTEFETRTLETWRLLFGDFADRPWDVEEGKAGMYIWYTSCIMFTIVI
jgi:hypothetical protein